MEEGRCASKILTTRPIGKKPLGIPKRTWENSVRMDLKEIVVSTKKLIDSAQNRDY